MYRIIVQRALGKKIFTPSDFQLKKWAKQALTFGQKKLKHSLELTIRLVTLKEITHLNQNYRRKSGPTNVLAFPFDMPEEIKEHDIILGDIIVCADVVNREAKAQDKTPKAHWAHMIVHGTLHLLGYDHQKNKDAIRMEAKEISILDQLNFSNPYQLEKIPNGKRRSQ